MKNKFIFGLLAFVSLASIVFIARADNIYSGGNDFVQSTMGSKITVSLFPTNGAPIGCYTNGQSIVYTFMGTSATYANVLPVLGQPANNSLVLTNLPVATIFTLNTVCTNSVSGSVTNYSTGANYPFGNTGGGGLGTNYDSMTVRLGPNERWGVLTNNGIGIGILYDELRQ